MTIAPAIRRANFWLFVGLVVFAFALCALVLVWMRARTRAQGGKVYPPVGMFCYPESTAGKRLLEVDGDLRAPLVPIAAPAASPKEFGGCAANMNQWRPEVAIHLGRPRYASSFNPSSAQDDRILAA